MKRVHIIPFPLALPGKCGMCGSSSQGKEHKYIDFGLSIPRYGAFIFCNFCIMEIFKELGIIDLKEWLSKEQYDKLIEEFIIQQGYQRKIDELVKENDYLRSNISNILSIRNDILDMSGNKSSTNEIGSSTADNKYERNAQRRTETKSGSVESTNVARHKDVPDTEYSNVSGDI